MHVIFRDSKDLGYGRDMYMNVYTNESVGSTCGPPGAVTIAWYVRNFSVKIVDGFAYGPINLEAAIGEDLQHHVGTNAIEFGYGRSDLGVPGSTSTRAAPRRCRSRAFPATAASCGRWTVSAVSSPCMPTTATIR